MGGLGRLRPVLNRTTPSNRAGRQILSLIAVLIAVTLGFVGPAAAQSIDDVGDEVDQTGRFVEKTVDAELEGAIDRANAADIGFVWLDQGGNDAEQIATSLAQYLVQIDSSYRSIVVLNNDSVWVTSRGDNGTEAGQNARELFAIGDEAGGLDLVTDTITGAIDGDLTTNTTTASGEAGSTSGESASSSSSSGFPWILLIVLGLLAFFGLRFLSGRRRSRKQLEANMEADRLEIREQLKNNADRVIDLGDRVIAAGDPEMIRTYEKASSTYQDVSQSIDAAATAEEVDRLDDRIDEAEWQFEVIEATLDGRPAPASPADLEPPPPPSADDRIDPPAAQERPTVTRRGRTVPPLGDPSDVNRRSSPSSTHQRQRRSTRSSGGGLGGMLAGGMGRMLMSVVASMLLGGISRGGTSRRSQRRGGFGGGFGSSSGGIGGPGGGVLRRRR